MAKAEIIITQDATVSPAGVALRGLDLYSVASKPIVFSNSSDGDIGVSSWQWNLIERPPGSTATLSGGGTGATTEIQADVYGRYVVSLTVNGMAQDSEGYAVTVAGVSFPSLGTLASGDKLGDWDPPAFNERSHANWTDFYGALNPMGGQREFYRIIEQIRLYAMPFLHWPGGNVKIIPFPLSPALTAKTDQPAPAWAIASYPLPFDASDLLTWASAVKFGCLHGHLGPAAATAQVQLYNITDAEAVTGAFVTTSLQPVIDQQSGALTIGAAAGNLKNSLKQYAVRHEITGGTPGIDYSTIFHPYLYVEI